MGADLSKVSGDLRNVIKTVTELPNDYNGRCEVVLNDPNFRIGARNIILLLTALIFEPATAAFMMQHTWYSAMIPAFVLQNLRERVLPLIQDTCTKIQKKDEETLCSKRWSFGERSVRLTLLKRFWDNLLLRFEVSERLPVARAQTLRATAIRAPSRKDCLEQTTVKLQIGVCVQINFSRTAYFCRLVPAEKDLIRPTRISYPAFMNHLLG